MNWSLSASLVCLALGSAAGCADRNQSFGLPKLFAGPSEIQRERATQFDPYPDQDMGPEVVGGRPLDYNRQIPEVERSRFTGGAAQPVTHGMERWRPNNIHVVPRMPNGQPGTVVTPQPGMAPATTMAPGGPGAY